MLNKTCKFHNPATGAVCRNGDSCAFLHSSASDGQSQSVPVAVRNNAPAGGQNKHTPTSPAGVCSFFWNKGSCNRGFNCKFKHSTNPGIEQRNRSEQPVPINALLPLLTEAGLAKVTGAGSDAYFTPKFQSPMRVQSGLQPFLREDFRFLRPSQVYKFVALLYSASADDPSWSIEDGQLLLNQMADPKGRGMSCLISVLTWPAISTNAGRSTEVLSFQAGYLPLLKYFASEYVVRSTLSYCKNALYSLIVQNIDRFADVIESCLNNAILQSKSFKDPSDLSVTAPSTSQVLKTMIVLLFECSILFKNSVTTYPRLRPLVLKLREWTNAWIDGINANPPLFDEDLCKAPKPALNYIIKHLNDNMNKLLAIVNREEPIMRPQKRLAICRGVARSDEGVLAALETSYEPPGENREGGPRHDNDFIDIQNIRIAPTHEELVSKIPPFLPANIYDAPHPFAIHSMHRLLDIQFRLLREELTAPLRHAIKLILDDLKKPTNVKTKLSELISKGGGKYRGHIDGHNAIMFNLYTNARFSSLNPEKRGISICLTFDAPPGRARSTDPKTRKSFWEGLSGKRLMQGGLIALIWKTSSETFIRLGTLASSNHDLTDSVAKSSERVQARVVFFDPRIELRIFQTLNSSDEQKGDTRFLVEAPVMFEAIRPFLEALRVEPGLVPFGEYLVHRPSGFFKTFDIKPPAYTQVPGFSFQLASLFPDEAEVHDLKLDTDPATIEHVRHELLTRNSRLDPSQANAIVDALTRELVLIQGPPGTGKSYTGVEILRVLIKNQIRPILMIAFTNHALDHILRSVLDANITRKIVRLGSRSKDERISQFSLETLERVSDTSKLKQVLNTQFRELKSVEDDIKNLLKNFSKSHLSVEDILYHLDIRYPDHHQSLDQPVLWISTLFHLIKRDDGQGTWRTAGSKGDGEVDNDTLWAFWRDGRDLEFLRKPDPVKKRVKDEFVPSPPTQVLAGSSRNAFSILHQVVTPAPQNNEIDEEDDVALAPEKLWQDFLVTDNLESINPDSHDPTLTDSDQDSQELNLPTEVSLSVSPPDSDTLNPNDLRVEDFFQFMGYQRIPLIPGTDRPIEELLIEGEMWSLSMMERTKLVAYWTNQMREEYRETSVKDFERLREKHAEVLRRHSDVANEARRQLLQNVDIIGCTTTGAAQLTSLLKGIAPKVMLIEEAGQVLEAHVLGSLVHGVEHLILIGDPLQLRPTIQNFALSIEHSRGSILYRFDMSLMERLATAGLPMSRIDVQRRMRPTISSLIRNTLYPGLQDHALVKNYPPVKGIAKNVFFFTHDHKENGGEDDSASKYNKFEVEIIVDLVLYLLRQGSYSGEGDIVVLCAYLGQLAKLRDALAGKIAVVLDERDQQELAMHEEEKDSDTHQLQHVKVSQRVLLRTIDNFQGEQARIVILSLVRNSGASPDEDDEGSVPIRSVNNNIGFLKSENRTNVALSRAQEGLYILGNAANLSSRSRMWRDVIEELRDSDALGEGFPIRCDRHPDDIQIISKPGVLPRVSPDGGCLLHCDHRLGCGHMCPYKCHSDDPNHIGVICSKPCTRLCIRQHPCQKVCHDACGQCHFRVANVELPCGHIKDYVACYMLDDLNAVFCEAQVIKQLPGCTHSATLQCSLSPELHRCKVRCDGILPCCARNCSAPCYECRDSNHQPHPCEKPLFCGHLCGKHCSQDHECNLDCRESCRQVCPHTLCREPCSSPCAPCQQPCTWRCDHYECPVPCGSICARFPCDKRCQKVLRCGHRCPSVCGEDCSIQKCPLCATTDERATVVDVVLSRTLGEMDPDKEELDELLITLRNCGHVFTVETLDGICELGSYYGQDANGKWCSLASGTNDFLKPPACPTCRSPITAARYGRVFKRADLDILERNVASRMSRGLSRVNDSLRSISTASMKQGLSQGISHIQISKSPPPPAKLKEAKRERDKLSRKLRELPLGYASLNPGDNKYHGVSSYDMTVWKPIIRPLFEAYTLAMTIAETRSSHTHAWEAAFGYLVRKELDSAAADPLRAPRNPEEHAMRMAKMMVGQPRPRSDTRFRVEVFWATIRIRFILVELARTWLKAISEHKDYHKQQQHVWAMYISFILDSCLQDAQAAFKIAETSGSRRQMTTTVLLIMKSELEGFLFDVFMNQKSEKQNRDALLKAVATKSQAAERHMRNAIDFHLKDYADKDWVSSNFRPMASKILDQWKELQQSIRKNTVFYEEVTREEMEFIVQGLQLPHTGHFFRCPNGHTFVIGDCGGASQVSQCPECQQPIGGTGHQLLAGNTRAMEYEEIARAQGVDRNPFPWGV